MNQKNAIITVAALVAIASGTVLAIAIAKRSNETIISTPEIALVDQNTLDGLPKKNGSSADTSRIAGGIIPPTNSWLSGMVLQSTPLPVYPMPLSFLAKDNGFEIGLPSVKSSSTDILGQHTPGISAVLQDATSFKLSRYDKISATLSYFNESQQLGDLTLAEGSPYVFYRASLATSLEITGVTNQISNESSTYLRYTKSGHDYVISTSSGARISVNGATASVSAPSGSLVTFYALPGSDDDNLKSFAGNELKSVGVIKATNQSKSITNFEYKTDNGAPTVFAPMSYAHVEDTDETLLTYDSIYGPMSALPGNSFKVSAPLLTPSNQLNLSKLADDNKKKLIATLQDDVAKTSITASDSYFAGKQLARAATLLDIAQQLGQTELNQRLKDILKEALSGRLGADYFYYDSVLKGVSAQTKSFGSEDFNDHHFHYGYFIYAASILGRYDADFLKNNQQKINLLVADIASYSKTDSFPLERNFDPYAAHSWAAGLAPFADGNNQESSSEAINAWNGVAKWAELIGNKPLKESATWMLSFEAATAKAAWRTVNVGQDYLRDYKAPLTSLSFGGKRTYSTFFSDEAGAKLGIQLLPMSPVMQNFASDRDTIDNVVNVTIRQNDYNVALGDYVLMYKALSDPQKASELLGSQKDSFIDDGNSRTYLQAWIYSLTDK